MADAADWGVAALERAAAGPDVQDGGPHLLRLRHQGQRRLEADARRRVAPVRADLSGAREEPIDQVSLECFHSHVPPELMRLLDGKDVMVGVIDVASDVIETPEQVAETIGTRAALRAGRAALPVHQLRHGADAARGRRGQARRARRRARRWRARADGDERRRAAPRRSPRRRPRRGAARARPRGARAGRLRRASPARASTELDALRAVVGRRCRPMRYLRDGGRYRRRRHASFVVDGGDGAPRRRIARTGSRSNTTRCTAASSAGSSRSRPRVVAAAGLARACSAVRRARVGAEGRAAVVRRGAPVPHRHDRRHRPADAGRRAPRRRRLRRRRAGRPRRASRAARRASSTPTARTACASRCSSRGPRCPRRRAA